MIFPGTFDTGHRDIVAKTIVPVDDTEKRLVLHCDR